MQKLLWLCFITLLGAYVITSVGDPDLWWHITSGRWILAHGQVPEVDYWNQFGNGLPWRAYSWSNEILFALVDRHFGLNGLLALSFAFGIILSATLCLSMGSIAGDLVLGALLGAIATAGSMFHFGPRPQTLSWICFACLLATVEQCRRQGVSALRLLVMFCLFAVWANSHITTLLGIALAAIWMFDASNKATSGKRALIVVAVCFLGTLLTPYHGAEWVTFFSKIDHPFRNVMVKEFEPANIYHPAVGIMLLLTTVMFLFLHFQPMSFQLHRIVGVGGLVLTGLMVNKFIPFANIALCAEIASMWNRYQSRPAALGNLGTGIALGIEKIRHMNGFLMSALCTVFLLGTASCLMKVWRAGIDENFVPERAVNFIQEHQLPPPLLNGFTEGGYLMYRFSDMNGNPNPQFLVTIDGRTNVNSKDALTNYMAAALGKANWKDYLNMVNPQTIIWSNKFPLPSLLLATKEWCTVFNSATDKDTFSGWHVLIKKNVLETRADLAQFARCE